MGALGMALGTMVANLSSHKRGWDDRWKEFSDWAEKGKVIQNRLLLLVEEDTDAFKRILEAYALPNRSDEEKLSRKNSVQEAIKNATMIPFEVMKTAYSGFEVIREMVENGIPSSITDAGVGALALRSCIRGACLNVKINASTLEDKAFARDIAFKACDIESKAMMEEDAIIKLIEARICPEGKK
jgi:glutamate formiminotransferase/formiminotetrahydrofolate cyclodeaminase